MPDVNTLIDVDQVLAGLKKAASTATNEEEFKINSERILYEEVLAKLKLQPGKYEYTFISGGRVDALYGHLIIEYKAPGKLSKSQEINKAKEQLIGYIKKEANVEERYGLFLGVILCDKIAFVKYDSKTRDWPLRGAYELNKESVLRLIEAIRGLKRKKLAVDELMRDFGPRSSLTEKTVKVLYEKLMVSNNRRTEALFNDWKRVFSQVCAYSPEKLEGLEIEYNISSPVNYDTLLFSIHTYYAFLMKLLGAEITYLYGTGKFLKSYVTELEEAYMGGLEPLKKSLEEIENGGIFKNYLNITNFVEGDYFSWYLEEFDNSVADALFNIAKKLADYEPASTTLEPEYTKDMLKRLYQNLIPKTIRHNLGEYYTPDWLAEQVLNEVGVTVEDFDRIRKEKNDLLAPLQLRILDPACGSGTFLILVIKRLREYAEEHYLGEELVKNLLYNVVGFDLNPLAVLASRTNYLLAIADILSRVKGPIEIPVYLADSLLVETRQTIISETSYIIRTYVGEFVLPQAIVDKGLLYKLLGDIDKYILGKYGLEDFKQTIQKEMDLSEDDIYSISVLYNKFLNLEKEGRNRIWASIIKNAFAPLITVNSKGKFDYVVGNPPWINWESLPESYRETSKVLWKKYRLLEKTKGMGLGKVKRDLSSLFLTRSLDIYLKDDGELSFLMPFTILKTHASAGFRIYVSSNGEIIKIDDMVDLFPFEGAINRTSLITIKKHSKTTFPVECTMWRKTTGGDIPMDASLEYVVNGSEQHQIIMAPIKRNNPKTPWMIVTEKAYEVLQKVMRPAFYRAFAGVYTGVDGAYYVNIQDKKENYVLVQNMHDTGKKKLNKVQSLVEADLVYPLVRGRDVKRWSFNSISYIIIPTDKRGVSISISKIRVEYPKTYEYFTNFFNELINRGGEPYKSQLELYRQSGFEAINRTPPFYMLFNVEHAISKYKVVWKNISGKISGKAEFTAAVVDPIDDDFLGRKIAIPNVKLMFIPTDIEDEAHYICAFLNNCIARLIVASYIIETGISTHVLQNVYIPKFDKENKDHLKLSNLSKEAHQLTQQGKNDELGRVEEEIDKTIARLYGLTDDELREIKKALALIIGDKEIVDEETREEPKEIKVEFLNAVIRPNLVGNIEMSIQNPLKEKIIIEMKLPKEQVRLETNKEDMLHVKVSPLAAGEYKVPFKVITANDTAEDEFTLYVREENRRREKEPFSSKLDELIDE